MEKCGPSGTTPPGRSDAVAGEESNDNNNNAEASTTAAAGAGKTAAPPQVITVDTSAINSSDSNLEEDKTSGSSAAAEGTTTTAATPKHANKTRENGNNNGANNSRQVPPGRNNNGFYPPVPYEGRPVGGNGAFQPHDSSARRQPPPPPPHGHPRPGDQYYNQPPMQVSPGAGAINGAGVPYDRRGGPPGPYYNRRMPPSSGYPAQHGHPPPPQHHPGYYDQRGPGFNEYGPPPPQQMGRGPPPPHPPPSGQRYEPPHSQQLRGPGPGQHQYPPQPYPTQSFSAYQSDPRNPNSYGPGHGGPPPPYPPPGAGQYPPSRGPDQHYPRDHPGSYPPSDHHGGATNNTFSRSVSTSFDRVEKEKLAAMAKSSNKNQEGEIKKVGGVEDDEHRGDASMASDDDSWKQLKQINSIDDSVIQEHLGMKKREAAASKDEAEEDDSQSRHPHSNSSSLTNSPTDGAERRANFSESIAAAAAAAVEAANNGPEDIQKASSLDELCSVASAQAAMDIDVASNNKKKTSLSGATTKEPSSPGTDADSESLDLMKCSSGSSGLLHLTPSKRDEGELYEEKDDGRDEERGDSNTGADGVSNKEEEELRRAPSGDMEEKQPRKKVRIESKESSSSSQSKATSSKVDKIMGSPLSITCSPSAAKIKKESATQKAPSSLSSTINKADYHASPHPGESSLYDKPPTHSYSMDSAPSIPRGNSNSKRKQISSTSNPTLPPRPASSSSSTLTPGQHMHIDNHQDPSNAVVSSIPSWEINAVDSFGGGSVGGGHGLSNNFSFQDYPMLSASESNLGAAVGEVTPGAQISHAPVPPTSSPGNPPYGLPPNSHPYMHPQHSNHPVIESRNQSFEGGHYHGGPGGLQRTDSMDVSYCGPPPGAPGGPPVYHDRVGGGGYRHGHTGPFPPHAPSWGTAGSGASHPSYQQQGHPGAAHHYMAARMDNYPPVMRNYSQDSGHRASPPPGPGGPHGHRGHYMHRPPPNFQPPPEFVAPHNPHLTRRPPPAVYIMSSQGANHPSEKRGTGVFSWSKDDDSRLTEIMKKYKNPRDWEPIAKEHSMGKSAKECHERWIRYLKPGVRKGQWTDQEDSIVIDAVTNSSEQPFTRWSDLAQRLPGRVGKQIRDRWVNHLNPNINHLPFSREDDLLLWEGHKKLGKRWVEISTKSFNSTRSENHIKNRWYSASFKKFISNEFGPDAYSGGKASKGKDDKPKTQMKQLKEEDPATKCAA